MQQKEIENGRLLVERASVGDVLGVKELLELRVRANADAYNQSLYYKSKNYWTPLHYAACKGHVEIVKMLIADGADVDCPDMFAVTPLHLAAENGHVDCLRILLEAGASCNLGTAAKRPQWVTNTVYPHVADTLPLHLAAKNNHVDCIVELMMNGADYNAVDGEGRTSMYIAAEMRHEDSVLAHLNNAYGKTILSLPVTVTEDTPLHQCVQHNMPRAVTRLLEHGSDVNWMNRLGLSPLHVALQSCSLSSPEIVHSLILRGYNTDINLPDGHGVTPLEYVAFKGFRQDRRPKLAAFLIAFGASFANIKNLRGHTLLQQELNRGTKDSIILCAIVKTLVRLPTLHSLGISIDGPLPPSYPPLRGARGPFASLEASTHSEFVQRCQWYQHLATSPRTLQHHCRVVVRNNLGPFRLRSVSSLPLPLPLKDYLLLEYDEYR
jgi:ankyrin repeat protein